MNVHFAYVVYKLTFPNGKIYVGKDIGGTGHSIRYFGSWSIQLVEADFTKEELSDLTIRKQILFESNDKVQVSMKEVEFIRALNSTNPSIGYNQWPRKQADRH
jgi:uncharacterized lipoprotein YehR (DUF1307 family)